MKWVRNYRLFRESAEARPYSPKNIVHEICVSMLLLNNQFLDNILDRGLKARYSEDSSIFITDLKNLILAKNRLMLGRFEDGKCVEDDEISKLSALFDGIEFSIEKDWNKLSNARTTSRNIIDKLLPDEKLLPERIRCIYWIGPNKDNEHSEDIVIELNDGKQLSLYLDKNLSAQKSASFNAFADDMLGDDVGHLYGDKYLPHWNKLAQQWVGCIYENANKEIQRLIERFIDPKRIDTLGYFEFFDIRHQDPKFRHLGEFIQIFDKNILKLSDLLEEVWKSRESCFIDCERVEREWKETKIFLLNSKILENLFTSSLKSRFPGDIKKREDDLKRAEGVVKMKLVKAFVEKLGCEERDLHYFGSNGNSYTVVPSRDVFRKRYDDISVDFDYHVKFFFDEEEDEKNDFCIKVRLSIEEKDIADLDISIKCVGGEFTGKLGAKYKFDLADDFNYSIARLSYGEED
jgi:hypothetical protein